MLITKENWFKNIGSESKTHRLIKKFWQEILVSFRYSLFGRIREIKTQDKIIILENSKFLKGIEVLYRNLNCKIIKYLEMSIIASSIAGFKKDLSSLSVRIASIILITAILTNIFLSLFFSILGAAFFRDNPFFAQKISSLGWIMRGLFLFIGSVGLFFDVDKEELKKTSFVLRSISIAKFRELV